MSLDFLVFCRDRPRLPEQGTVLGPVRVGAPRPVSDEDRPALADASHERTPWVVDLSCSSAAAPIADLIATTIAQRSGGGALYCDADGEALPVAAEQGTDADLLAELQAIVDDAGERARREKERAVAAFERARAADPEAFDEANDWSDVL